MYARKKFLCCIVREIFFLKPSECRSENELRIIEKEVYYSFSKIIARKKVKKKFYPAIQRT